MVKDPLFAEIGGVQDSELVRAIYSSALLLMHHAVLPGRIVESSVPSEKRAQALGKIGLLVFAEMLEIDHMIALDKTATLTDMISHG